MLSSNGNLHGDLISRRIFVARYWPELSGQPDCEQARYLARHLVPLPCDQRYTPADMQKIIDTCHSSFAGHEKKVYGNYISQTNSAAKRSKAS